MIKVKKPIQLQFSHNNKRTTGELRYYFPGGVEGVAQRINGEGGADLGRKKKSGETEHTGGVEKEARGINVSLAST